MTVFWGRGEEPIALVILVFPGPLFGVIFVRQVPLHHISGEAAQ